MYYMDFLRDVIGDLQQEYDLVHAAAAEEFERSRKLAGLATKGD